MQQLLIRLDIFEIRLDFIRLDCSGTINNLSIGEFVKFNFEPNLFN